jgi:hypothetical protein
MSKAIRKQKNKKTAKVKESLWLLFEPGSANKMYIEN